MPKVVNVLCSYQYPMSVSYPTKIHPHHSHSWHPHHLQIHHLNRILIAASVFVPFAGVYPQYTKSTNKKDKIYGYKQYSYFPTGANYPLVLLWVKYIFEIHTTFMHSCMKVFSLPYSYLAKGFQSSEII